MRLLLGSRGAFIALFLVYAAAGVHTTRSVHATGDEPAYFMAADALIHGEGLDLTRRWERIADADYTPGVPVSRAELDGATSPSRVRGGAYPLHDVATSVLILPPYALGGRGLVVLLIGAAMAAAVALGHRTTRTLGASERLAAAGAYAVGLAAPALTYSGQVFADALAPLPFALALAALCGAAPRRLLGPAAALLVLLHLRFWPLALALLAIELVRTRPTLRAAAVLVAPLAAAVVALSLLDLVVYGVPLPHAGFLLFFTDRPTTSVVSYTRSTGEGLLGLFIDRSFGLLAAAPIMTLLFAGAGRVLRDDRQRWLLALPLPYLALASVLDWTGGFNPQARYLTVLTPLFVVLLARALAWRPARALAVPLAVWTLAQSVIFVARPWLRYDAYGAPPLVDLAWTRVFHLTPSAVFPLFGSSGAAPLALLWVAALAVLVVAAARAASRPVTAVS